MGEKAQFQTRYKHLLTYMYAKDAGCVIIGVL